MSQVVTAVLFGSCSALADLGLGQRAHAQRSLRGLSLSAEPTSSTRNTLSTLRGLVMGAGRGVITGLALAVLDPSALSAVNAEATG